MYSDEDRPVIHWRWHYPCLSSRPLAALRQLSGAHRDSRWLLVSSLSTETQGVVSAMKLIVVLHRFKSSKSGQLYLYNRAYSRSSILHETLQIRIWSYFYYRKYIHAISVEIIRSFMEQPSYSNCPRICRQFYNGNTAQIPLTRLFVEQETLWTGDRLHVLFPPSCTRWWQWKLQWWSWSERRENTLQNSPAKLVKDESGLT